MGMMIKYSEDDLLKMEIRDFIDEGMTDVYRDNLVEFDPTFDELEKRYDD